jgi:hypothetical protein
MYYSILFIKGEPGFVHDTYAARYRRKLDGFNGHWIFYADGVKHTWEDAWNVLEQHTATNPAQLERNFVGTF